MFCILPTDGDAISIAGDRHGISKVRRIPTKPKAIAKRAEMFVRRHDTMSLLVPIDDVVMNKKEEMHEFDRDRRFEHPRRV